MAVRSRFTRIPKVHDLILAGVPTEVIPTYCALADYSNNKTGLCWPRMETLARRLSRSPRTIQRHLHLLREKGLVEFVERKRDWHGRFGAYLYRVVHIAAAAARKGAAAATTSTSKSKGRRRKKDSTTGHTGRMAPNKGLTKRHEDSPIPPKKDLKSGYWWFFGEEAPPGAQEQHQNEVKKKREEEAQRRREGYEWFFK
ncbi:MAG: helix-turn-helix domain-containing protein [Actinobacteria bacterium]|nr:helix-turn-helix domain-containing protein [Actinomycetota bacterium]MCA1737840.1 helix-turn-helix domain-containing protein [Actinomycetota bacterium]